MSERPRLRKPTILGGSDYFVSEGSLVKTRIQISPGLMKVVIEDQRNFERWKHEHNIQE